MEIRSIEKCVEAFRASQPDGELTEPPTDMYDAAKAYAFADLSEWPSRPPVRSLYLMKRPDGYSSKVLTDPKVLVEYAHFNAVGTWNANGTARWLAGPDWIVADVALVQEQ